MACPQIQGQPKSNESVLDQRSCHVISINLTFFFSLFLQVHPFTNIKFSMDLTTLNYFIVSIPC
jgi:hypothetical protein